MKSYWSVISFCYIIYLNNYLGVCLFKGLKGSLERLQLDYVDIVFANKPDPHTPMEGNGYFCSATLQANIQKSPSN